MGPRMGARRNRRRIRSPTSRRDLSLASRPTRISPASRPSPKCPNTAADPTEPHNSVDPVAPAIPKQRDQPEKPVDPIVVLVTPPDTPAAQLTDVSEIRAAKLFGYLADTKAEWQERAVAGPLSSEEIQDQFRRLDESARGNVDAYVVGDGSGGVIAVLFVPSRDEQQRVADSVRDLVHSVLAEAAKASMDSLVGVPLSLSDLPRDLPAAVFWAIGLHDILRR